VTFATLAVTALLLASCGSASDLGGIFGGPQTSSSSDVYGTVNTVDTRNQRIDLTIDDTYSGSRTQTVYYDSRTRVTYRNQTGSPSQLERGDRVSIHLINNGGQTVAETINVTQSVSESSTYPGTSTYPSSTTGRVTGTVNFIDTSARLINVNASYVTGLRTSSNNTYTVYYDTRTRVMYQGRTYAVEDLERGDQIDVTTYNSSNGQSVADTITVTRNVRQ
jgi:hypothetical protein